MTRPRITAHTPVHVVLRVVRAIGSLRRRHAYHAIREATYVAARRENFRIVHLSLQRTHVHLIVEANDQHALAAGLQAFQISAARQLNAAVGKANGGRPRRGAVFPDRYHAEVISSPRQARHTLIYVLANYKRHQEDRGPLTRDWHVDWFSSAAMFPDWQEYGDDPFLMRGPPTYEPLMVRRPQSWLLQRGWKLAGTIAWKDAPASRS
jgi:REP element-mobilizing transposase RayT